MADSDWLPLLSLQIVSSRWSGVASRFWLSWFWSTNKIFCIWKKGTRNDWEIIYLSIYLIPNRFSSLLFSASVAPPHVPLYLPLSPISSCISVSNSNGINPIWPPLFFFLNISLYLIINSAQRTLLLLFVNLSEFLIDRPLILNILCHITKAPIVVLYHQMKFT